MYRANYLSETPGACSHQRFSGPGGNFSCGHRPLGARIGNGAVGNAVTQYRTLATNRCPQHHGHNHNNHNHVRPYVGPQLRQRQSTPNFLSLEPLSYQPARHFHAQGDLPMRSPVRAFMPQQQTVYSVPGNCRIHSHSQAAVTPQDIRSMSGVLGTTYIGLENSTPNLPIRKVLGMVDTWLMPPYADVNVDIYACKQAALTDLKRKADLLAQQECKSSTKPGKTAIIHLGSSPCPDGEFILSGTAVILQDDEMPDEHFDDMQTLVDEDDIMSQAETYYPPEKDGLHF